MPSFEFRLSTAKLLIELADYERALDVIETMVLICPLKTSFYLCIKRR